MNRRLSITIVAHKDYDDVKKAIVSIEKYTDANIDKRIYVVDNSCNESGDTDKEAFVQFVHTFDDVIYLDTGKNLGFGKGHNYIMDKIDSEYHAIVNPDIELTEDVFTALLEYMDVNDEVGMCIPRINDEAGNLQRAYREEPTVFDMFIRMFCKALFPKRIDKHTLQYMDYSEPFQVPFAQGCFLVIRSGLFKQLGGFDDKFFLYMEDADLCRRVNEISKLMYYPGASVIHKWNRESHKNFKLFRYHIQSMKYYFKKWGMKWS